MNLSEITALVETRLSRKRFIHSLAVAAQAVRLSGIFSANPRQAYTAAILHDIDRELTETQWLARADRIAVPEIYRYPSVLLHGFTGEETAKTDFLIDDLDVLQAIRYHTLGHVGMGKTAQIIFISDYISRDRAFVDEHFRKKIYESPSLTGALLLAAEATAAYFEKSGRNIHPDTKNMIESLRRI